MKEMTRLKRWYRTAATAALVGAWLAGCDASDEEEAKTETIDMSVEPNDDVLVFDAFEDESIDYLDVLPTDHGDLYVGISDQTLYAGNDETEGYAVLDLSAYGFDHDGTAGVIDGRPVFVLHSAKEEGESNDEWTYTPFEWKDGAFHEIRKPTPTSFSKVKIVGETVIQTIEEASERDSMGYIDLRVTNDWLFDDRVESFRFYDAPSDMLFDWPSESDYTFGYPAAHMSEKTLKKAFERGILYSSAADTEVEGITVGEAYTFSEDPKDDENVGRYVSSHVVMEGGVAEAQYRTGFNTLHMEGTIIGLSATPLAYSDTLDELVDAIESYTGETLTHEEENAFEPERYEGTYDNWTIQIAIDPDDRERGWRLFIFDFDQ